MTPRLDFFKRYQEPLYKILLVSSNSSRSFRSRNDPSDRSSHPAHHFNWELIMYVEIYIGRKEIEVSTGATPLPLGNRMVVGQRLFSSGFLRSYNTRQISKVCVYSRFS